MLNCEKKYFVFIMFTIFVSNLFAQNYALKFDGKDDQIDIFLEKMDQWTLSVWVKSDKKWSEKETIVGSGWISLPEYWEDYPLLIKNGTVNILRTSNLTAPDTLDDQWHHIAVTNDATKQSVFIDGKIVAKREDSRTTVPSFIGSNAGKDFFSGVLDEIRIWNIALDEKVISDWMYKPVESSHPFYNNLRLYYTFDDRSLDATDYKGVNTGNIKPDDGPSYIVNDNELFHWQKIEKGFNSPSANNIEEPTNKLNENDSSFVFKHLSWNIWHGGKEFGEIEIPERIIEVIRISGADIVTMQETYGSGPRISDSLGFFYYTIGKEGSNLSIMSRYPFVDTLASKFHSFYCGGAIVKLPNNKEIIVFDTWLNYKIDITLDKFIPNVQPKHFINNDLESNTRNIKEIIDLDVNYYTENKDLPVIISGDFNSCSHLDWTKEYVALGHSNGLVVEHPTSKVMKENGFVDSYREIHPNVMEKPGVTWSPLYKYNLPVGDRIDFIYYRGNKIKAIDSKVISEFPNSKISFPSDHAAVLTTFRVNNE